jgi:biopolymer transport protein ExbB
MEKAKNVSQTLTSVMGVTVIIVSLVASYFIYHNILGHPDNFIGGDPSNEPIKGNYLGVIYKGSSIVIVQLAFILILLTYTIERGINLARAGGKGKNKDFANRIKALLGKGDLEGIHEACDKQRGSVGNIVRKGVDAYTQVVKVENLRPEEKAFRLKRELEEATHLELPHLERNMAIISTIASVATLIGLLGTVTGMIRAFSALARAGSPDAVGLAGGISQALVTTALGISTAAVAIVIYNFYTGIIDRITYAADETNYALLSRFKEEVSE